ncbi:MAG: hypothetical protein N2117_11090 [Anaerolineales bacterium]|nr:hypothetical protein [Anaerolineales bacterium]MCX7755771.1 hypothetical protein [Anaerolineales bacterium]MDW8279029.1 hypothetical protein [Anaerolineales bacterium]
MKNRSQLALGVILILLGVWFIAQQQIPALKEWVGMYMQWPLNIVAIGGLILLLGILFGAPGMAIPASIVAGIGGILYYQQTFEDYESWSYMWTLIIGFIGVGQVLSGLLGSGRGEIASGLNTIVVSAVLFVLFAAIFGKLTILGSFGPAILLILLGMWVIARSLWRNRRKEN